MKHAGGRPQNWKTPKELIDKIQEYFHKCDKDIGTMPTKAGLALHLDTTRETLGDYENGSRDTEETEGKFSYAIKRAYGMIEDCWTQRLTGNNATGPIFYLKAAFHYKDRMDITTAGDKINNEEKQKADKAIGEFLAGDAREGGEE